MITLKVGDKVVLEKKARFGRNISYDFAEVVRVTKTQAILSNDTRLRISSRRNWSHQEVFDEIGSHYDPWELSTPEIVEKAKIEQNRRKVEKWFSNHNFTDQQKAVIYEMFKDAETTNTQ